MRINVINPSYLTDQHLVAEYREMKMSTYFYEKSKNTKAGIEKHRISERFTLNKGHAYMWYDKMGYVKKRFEAICTEMRARRFRCDYDKLNFTNVDKEAFGDFTPTILDIRINLDRILERLAKQPKWYKYKGRVVEDWNAWYQKHYMKGKLY
jgi:deoxyribonuclease (pyrimidine dimer)